MVSSGLDSFVFLINDGGCDWVALHDFSGALLEVLVAKFIIIFETFE